jgi:hypothetical protein
MSEIVPDKPVEDAPSGASEEVVGAGEDTRPDEPSEIVTDEPVEDEPIVVEGEIVDASESAQPEEPAVTFKANTYDLVSLGALAAAAWILLSCLTCNMSYYCLPILSIALGIIGVLQAREAVEEERTKLWSWLGIAGGGITLLIILAAIVLYIVFIAVMVATGELQ